MRWILLKDLQILRRSPLLLILLVAYSASIAVMIGAATRDNANKPKVAFLNEIKPQDDEFTVAGQRLKASSYADQLFESVTPVEVSSRAEARQKVRDGDVLAAIIVPADTTDRLKAALALSGDKPPPTLGVIYNGADPIQARALETTIKGRLADANQAISEQLTKAAARDLEVLLRGGGFGLLDKDYDVLGLERSEEILAEAIADLPADSGQRAGLERVRRFAHLAVENLDFAGPVLKSVGEPLQTNTQVINARGTPDDQYYVAVALTLSALFVALLLGAGMLALEREEHTYARLSRGLVSPFELISAKIALGAVMAFAVAVAMAAAIGLFVSLSLGSAPLWLATIALACLAFGAAGVALGAVAPDVRAASLLGVLVALPMAFIALIPPSAVSPELGDVIKIVSAPFPFRPALKAVDGALSGGTVTMPVVHLLILIGVYATIARSAAKRLR
jgi:ABC-2 type transport system permease protein